MTGGAARTTLREFELEIGIAEHIFDIRISAHIHMISQVEKCEYNSKVYVAF